MPSKNRRWLDTGLLIPAPRFRSEPLWSRIICVREGGDERWFSTARELIPFTAPAKPVTLPELTELAYQLGTTLAGAADAMHAVYPDAELPSLDQETTQLTVTREAHDMLLSTLGSPSWKLTPSAIIENALRARHSLGKALDMLAPFRRLGAPIPPVDEELRKSLDAVELDEYDLDMLAPGEEYSRRAPLWTIRALTLVRIAGRLGWTLAHAHWRLSRLAPIGLTLEYPNVEIPDEIVRWEDLLLLTTCFDGQPPVLSGRVDQAYLEHAAEEIYDDPSEKTAGHAAWLRTRLALYAPLFQLDIAGEDADG